MMRGISVEPSIWTPWCRETPNGKEKGVGFPRVGAKLESHVSLIYAHNSYNYNFICCNFDLLYTLIYGSNLIQLQTREYIFFKFFFKLFKVLGSFLIDIIYASRYDVRKPHLRANLNTLGTILYCKMFEEFQGGWGALNCKSNTLGTIFYSKMFEEFQGGWGALNCKSITLGTILYSKMFEEFQGRGALNWVPLRPRNAIRSGNRTPNYCRNYRRNTEKKLPQKKIATRKEKKTATNKKR